MQRPAGLFLLFLSGVAAAYANPIETLYLMNNGDYTAYIWVNNAYQGYVPAGEARYTLKEGFVTSDSGFQEDGTLKQTYSHAGWGTSGDTTSVVIELQDAKGRLYTTQIDTSGDKEQKAYVWFGQTDSRNEPDPLVWEQSSQIQNASAPQAKKVYGNAKAETRGGRMSLAAFIGEYERRYTWEDGSINEDSCAISANGQVSVTIVSVSPASPPKTYNFTVSKVLSRTELLIQSANGRESRLSKTGSSVVFSADPAQATTPFTKVR